MAEPAFDLICCVCGGWHHPADCELARRYVRECRTAKVSPTAEPPAKPLPPRPEMVALVRLVSALVDEHSEAYRTWLRRARSKARAQARDGRGWWTSDAA